MLKPPRFIRAPIKRLLHRFGYEVSHTSIIQSAEDRLSRHIIARNFTVILDVGANIGQYAQNLRDRGYTGKLISFEPLSEAFSILSQKSAQDPDWHVLKLALGSQPGKAKLNVSRNLVSSSIRELEDITVKAEPATSYVDSELVEVAILDDLYHGYAGPSDHVLLKLDVQGYENEVLAGAERSLEYLAGLQLEMSLVPEYKGQLLCHEMISFLLDRDFVLVDIQRVFEDRTTGQLLEIDGLFLRRGEISC